MTYDEAVRHLDAYADAIEADPSQSHRWAGWSVWRPPNALRRPGEFLWKVSIGDNREAFGETREAAVIHAGKVLERRLKRFGTYTHEADG